MHPIFCAHLIILGLLNLDITSSTPPFECLHCLFVCNLQFKPISLLYIQILHNECSSIENVQRRRRSRAEFGLVFNSDHLFQRICFKAYYGKNSHASIVSEIPFIGFSYFVKAHHATMSADSCSVMIVN